ncbi:MAG: hypothetical protein Q8P34_13240 [Bacteroidota bacterium]|nr:hypothetical protein [Bacteroidota bacterium]
MIGKNYSIYTTPENTFELMCQSLFLQVGQQKNVLKIVFFGSPLNNEEYIQHQKALVRLTKANFPELIPLVSYVAQKPLIDGLSAEVVWVDTLDNITIAGGDNYLVLDNGFCRELLTGGIFHADISAPVSVQTNAVFEQIEQILNEAEFPLDSIVRQWNYIEDITRIEGDRQHYQDFNDLRSHFYAKAKWCSGYPAATGIGTQCGGVMVEIIAISGNELINRVLDNPLQIAAHHYSEDVLLGEADPAFRRRTTPKFERARVIGSSGNQTVFISGTAAIRGEASLNEDDVLEQTKVTMANIDYLISDGNYPSESTERTYKMLRIYIKTPSMMELVHEYMKKHYPETTQIFICADVCREELLIEIEGVAEINNSNSLF